jgi:hypothetical protein
MRITETRVLKTLAVLLLLLAGGLPVAILKYPCCGVDLFSPQVSWDTRLQFLAIPAVPFMLGLFLLLKRSAKQDP